MISDSGSSCVENKKSDVNDRDAEGGRGWTYFGGPMEGFSEEMPFELRPEC